MGGTSKRRGGEIQISFTHAGIWSPEQVPIKLLKLILMTIKSVSVSVIKTEINSKIIFRVRVILVHLTVCREALQNQEDDQPSPKCVSTVGGNSVTESMCFVPEV